jgi:hypothetical protein
MNPKKKEKEYLVKWRVYHEKDVIWVLAKNMGNAKEIIRNFEQDRGSNKRQRGH